VAEKGIRRAETIYKHKNDSCLKLFQEWGEGGIESSGWDEFIHYKNFCKYHNIPPSSTPLKTNKLIY
jgi:hypothetical protein